MALEIKPVCASRKEIAKLFQVSEWTVTEFAMRENDPLPRFRYPGQKLWRYDLNDALAWYERNRICA